MASLEQEGEGNENTLLHEETLDMGQIIMATEAGWGMGEGTGRFLSTPYHFKSLDPH